MGLGAHQAGDADAAPCDGGRGPAMPQDMLREMWLGLKRFWGLRWVIKVPVLLGVVGLVVLVALAVFALQSEGLSEAEQHNSRGASLAGDRRFEGALAEFDSAIEEDPELAMAYMN